MEVEVTRKEKAEAGSKGRKSAHLIKMSIRKHDRPTNQFTRPEIFKGLNSGTYNECSQVVTLGIGGKEEKAWILLVVPHNRSTQKPHRLQR
jgi:hypothetical protein